MYQKDWEYEKYTAPHVLDKEMHSLEGIVKGIAIDNHINIKEVEALLRWCERHKAVSTKSPFKQS